MAKKKLVLVPKFELPVVKGMMQPVVAGPNPQETVVIYRAQSILTMNGKVGPLLSYQNALDVLKWAGEK